MSTMHIQEKLVEDFLKVANIAGISLTPREIEIEILSAPHCQPPRLPTGKKAIYVFSAAELCLKVGKAGPNSNPRFTSQHYNPKSSRSNLAKSILRSKPLLKSKIDTPRHVEIDQLSEENIKSWIETNSTRYHFFIDSKHDDLTLSLFEAFVQCRLKPLFEGQ